MAAPGSQPVLEDAPTSQRPRSWAARKWHSIRAWCGYAWFMTLGTFLPLPMLLFGYVMNITILGTPVAQQIYRFAIFSATFGQEPPGKEKLAEHAEASDKKPFAERTRPYSPPGILEKRGRPVATWLRWVWFVFAGWWLGALWVVFAWAVLLLPYPFLDMIRDRLAELPSVMTLAMPAPRRGSTPESPLNRDRQIGLGVAEVPGKS
jgi:uncharacterized membrane protein YccF (DUF307 family)